MMLLAMMLLAILAKIILIDPRDLSWGTCLLPCFVIHRTWAIQGYVESSVSLQVM